LAFAVPVALTWFTWHVLCSSLLALPVSSEFETAFARGIGQRLDAAVVEIAAAVEHHLADPLGLGALRHQLAHHLCRFDIGAGLEPAAHLLFERRSLRQRLALPVVAHLRID